MTIPTEPIGSIPRPPRLLEAIATSDGMDPRLEPLYDEAIRDTIEQFEATGSPVITDGEQRKYHNFGTYSVQGLPNTDPDGFKIPFSAGHTRRMLRLTRGPLRYWRPADEYLEVALRYAHVPVKQAVISSSALSLMDPAEPIPDSSREQFLDDLLREHETEVRNCLRKGAHTVQIDFTEGRLAVKKKHGGTVTAESAGAGQGSLFTVRLPALGMLPQAPSGTPLQGDSVVSGPRRRILVVDDSRDSARSMARLLGLRGHEVHTARDGVEAVQAAEEVRPEVILMDAGMPRLNGFEATRRIRQRPGRWSVTIITLTGWGQEGDRLESKAAGCDGHLVKPVDLADLETLLTELGARGAANPRGGKSQSAPGPA